MARITAMLVLSAMAGCAYVPIDKATTRRVSTDYKASGPTDNVQAFVYGNRTILTIEGMPALLMVRDESGAAVDYNRIGNYYRLATRLDNFTAWINGRSVSFEATPTVQVFSSTLLATKPADPIDNALLALLHISARQLQDVRELLPSKNAWQAMEARYWPATSATVWVNYPESSSTFTTDPEFSKAIVEAAKRAEKITLRGRTDAASAGRLDGKIARDRALAARNFLVSNGIKPGKIRVLSTGAGDFLVPNDTEKGRALNRRVEIEMTSPRLEVVKQSVPIGEEFT